MEKMNFRDVKDSLINDKNFAEKKKETEGNWQQYDRSLFEFGNTFQKTLPEEYVGKLDKKIFTTVKEYGIAFKNYIEETLKKNNTNARTAIEFGGPGSNLFAGFSEGFFENTVGVCLDDVRDVHEKRFDQTHGHSVVPGDLFDVKNEEFLKKIFQSINSEKTDLIVSRMMGPLNDLSKHPLVLDRVIRKWYSMLNKNGIIFVQFEFFKQHSPNEEVKYLEEINPPFEMETEKEVKEWVDAINKKFPKGIEIQLGRGVMRLHKTDKAPEELPSIKELLN
jgi:hypothetical protein